MLQTKAEKTLKTIGRAETRTKTLHPARGIIRYAIKISNDEPKAHITCTSKIIQTTVSA